MGVTFDNSRILSEGFTAPPTFTSYIKVCMEKPKIDIASQFMEDIGMFKV